MQCHVIILDTTGTRLYTICFSYHNVCVSVLVSHLTRFYFSEVYTISLSHHKLYVSIIIRYQVVNMENTVSDNNEP